jgi:hypothetical protein
MLDKVIFYSSDKRYNQLQHGPHGEIELGNNVFPKSLNAQQMRR